jgi:RHS repeat-associated protein
LKSFGTRTFGCNLSDTLELQTESFPSFYNNSSAQARLVTYSYDTAGTGTKGRPTGLALGVSGSSGADQATTYSYQADGRLSGVTGNAAGYSAPAFTYTYVTNSHLLASTVNTTLGYTDVRTYLAANSALDVRETKWGATTKAKFDYTHDTLYRVITSAKTGEVFNIYGNDTQGLETDYAYNDRSELTADSTTLGGSSTPLSGRDDYHAYDPIGNRTSVNRSGTTVNYTANALNQYTSFTGSATHTYDDDGNLTGDGAWNNTWDGENRLAATETATGVTPKQKLDFAYDYLGRRVRKRVYSWSGSAWQQQADLRSIYRGWSHLAVLDGSTGAAQRQFIWGLDLTGTLGGAGGVGGLLLAQEGGNSYLPAYDSLGNIHAMIKATDGTLAAIYEYDAFGQTIRATGPFAQANPFRFATKYTDSETGGVDFGRRIYLPSLARFANRDPISEAGGLNLYAYVLNNPSNRWDYLGMDASGKSAWVPGRGYFYSSWSPGGNSSGSPSGGGGGGGAGENVVIEVVEPDGSKSYYVHANGVGVSLAPGAAVATAPAGFSLGSSVSVSFSGGAAQIHSSGVTPLRQGNVIIGQATVLADDVLEPVGGWTPTPRSNLPDRTEADIRAGFENSSRGAPDAWGAVHGAMQQTFGNAVFQQPLTTLAAAAFQTTALVGASYAVGTAAIAATPVVISEAVTMGRVAVLVTRGAYVEVMVVSGHPVSQIVLNNGSAALAAFAGASVSLPNASWGEFAGNVYDLGDKFVEHVLPRVQGTIPSNPPPTPPASAPAQGNNPKRD